MSLGISVHPWNHHHHQSHKYIISPCFLLPTLFLTPFFSQLGAWVLDVFIHFCLSSPRQQNTSLIQLFLYFPYVFCLLFAGERLLNVWVCFFISPQKILLCKLLKTLYALNIFIPFLSEILTLHKDLSLKFFSFKAPRRIFHSCI